MAPAKHHLRPETISRQAPGRPLTPSASVDEHAPRLHARASLQALAIHPLMKSGLPASDHSETLHRRYG